MGFTNDSWIKYTYTLYIPTYTIYIKDLKFTPVQLLCHSVLERICVKGSYLSQWLPQGERGPPKESKSPWIEIFHGGSH